MLDNKTIRKTTVNLAVLLLALLFVGNSFLVLAQDPKEPPLKETERYFVELLTYLDKIDRDGNATAKDWEEYLKKIPGTKVNITLPKNMTEEKKKEWLKSVSLALLYLKNQFGFKLSENIREFKCVPSRHGTLGSTEGPINNVSIICPSGQSTNWIFTVFLHELVHMLLKHPPVAGREYEEDVHNFIKNILPGVIDKRNMPRQYDLFEQRDKKN